MEGRTHTHTHTRTFSKENSSFLFFRSHWEVFGTFTVQFLQNVQSLVSCDLITFADPTQCQWHCRRLTYSTCMGITLVFVFLVSVAQKLWAILDGCIGETLLLLEGSWTNCPAWRLTLEVSFGTFLKSETRMTARVLSISCGQDQKQISGLALHLIFHCLSVVCNFVAW